MSKRGALLTALSCSALFLLCVCVDTGNNLHLAFCWTGLLLAALPFWVVWGRKVARDQLAALQGQAALPDPLTHAIAPPMTSPESAGLFVPGHIDQYR